MQLAVRATIEKIISVASYLGQEGLETEFDVIRS